MPPFGARVGAHLGMAAGVTLVLVVAAVTVACKSDQSGSGIKFDGRWYSATCAPVNEALLAEELGRVPFELEEVDVRAVDGIDVEQGVAAHTPGGCLIEETQWALWLVDAGDAARVTRLPEYEHLLDQDKLRRLQEYEACIQTAQDGAEEQACR